MNFFKKNCPHCGKENPVGRPDAEGFCGRVCETNYKYERKYGKKA
jgi:hypothetical protein